ncbi:hypothetical protein Agub_g11896, partial [Astrephomene gubernaculifera]
MAQSNVPGRATGRGSTKRSRDAENDLTASLRRNMRNVPGGRNPTMRGQLDMARPGSATTSTDPPNNSSVVGVMAQRECPSLNLQALQSMTGTFGATALATFMQHSAHPPSSVPRTAGAAPSAAQPQPQPASAARVANSDLNQLLLQSINQTAATPATGAPAPVSNAMTAPRQSMHGAYGSLSANAQANANPGQASQPIPGLQHHMQVPYGGMLAPSVQQLAMQQTGTAQQA